MVETGWMEDEKWYQQEGSTDKEKKKKEVGRSASHVTGIAIDT